jgi:hypothetical protein
MDHDAYMIDPEGHNPNEMSPTLTKVVPQETKAKTEEWTSRTYAGFRGGFMAYHRRAPTNQEIFDAGVQAGLLLAKEGKVIHEPDAEPVKEEWPMLRHLHLVALVFAYNEGFSKAYDRRIFPNPFNESGSQAAAWELGTRDGTKLRYADDAEKLTLRHQLLVSKEWITQLTDELIKDCDRAVRQSVKGVDPSIFPALPGVYDTCFESIIQRAIERITMHKPD